STDDSKTVQLIAAQLFGANVINNVQLGGVQQVQLEVVVAIVNRSAARNMAFSFLSTYNNGVNSSFIGNILAPGSLSSTLATSLTGATSSLTSTGGNIP